jgi:hypothetical protein
MYRMFGIGAVALGFGAALALAFLGYSHLLDRGSSADRIGDSISRALTRTPLTVVLDKNSSVQLDTRNSIVRLDPDAKVTVTGNVGLDPNASVRLQEPPAPPSPPPVEPAPSNAQRSGPMTDRNGRPVATKYTVFKTVPYRGGEVTTGYQFLSGSDVPHHQYCYFIMRSPGGSAQQTDLAVNGAFRSPTNVQRGLDARDAASNCIWFDNNQTRM